MGSGETDILKQEYKVDGKMTYLFIREYPKDCVNL